MLFIARLVPRRRDGFVMEDDQDPYTSDEEAVPIKQEEADYHA